MKWLEISLQLPGELAEPVAELLGRVVPEGVAIDQAPAANGPPGHNDMVLVRGWLPRDSALASRKRSLEEGLWHLSQIHPLPDPVYRPILESDWSDSWRASHRPVAVGQRLLILPPWLHAPQGPRIPIHIEPGMAFGTGAHPTTQHCLESLEAYIRPGDTMADLGCGSGILGIAAVKLGAGRALALDIDPQAVAATRAGARGNHVADQLLAMQGSLAELLEHLDHHGLQIQLLVANILASTLEAMLASGLERAVEPEGTIVLSGLLDEQLDSILDQAGAVGLELVEVKAAADWRTPIFRRKTPPGWGRRLARWWSWALKIPAWEPSS